MAEHLFVPTHVPLVEYFITLGSSPKVSDPCHSLRSDGFGRSLIISRKVPDWVPQCGVWWGPSLVSLSSVPCCCCVSWQLSASAPWSLYSSAVAGAPSTCACASSTCTCACAPSTGTCDPCACTCACAPSTGGLWQVPQSWDTRGVVVEVVVAVEVLSLTGWHNLHLHLGLPNSIMLTLKAFERKDKIFPWSQLLAPATW